MGIHVYFGADVDNHTSKEEKLFEIAKWVYHELVQPNRQKVISCVYKNPFGFKNSQKDSCHAQMILKKTVAGRKNAKWGWKFVLRFATGRLGLETWFHSVKRQVRDFFA